jgi:hypothetical protein
VTHPRISDLMRGKTSRSSLDALVNMLTYAGMEADFRIKPAPGGLPSPSWQDFSASLGCSTYWSLVQAEAWLSLARAPGPAWLPRYRTQKNR